MKKITSFLFAVVLVAFSTVSAFSAGINVNEREVIDALNTPITTSAGSMKLPTEYVNQAESYFNTIDMTAEESQQIIVEITEMGEFITNTGVANIPDMTYDQKQELLAYGQDVVGVIGLTMIYDKSSQMLIITDPSNKAVFSSSAYLEPVGSNSGTGNKPNFNNSNSNANNGIIKPTGVAADFGGFTAVSLVAVILVAAGAVYFIKVKKEA